MLRFRIRPFAEVLLLASVVLTGCNQFEVAPATYPPGYVYLDRGQIKDTMTRLSTDIWTINDILDSSETILDYERERIVASLEDMEEAANELGAGGRITNHLIFDNNIDSFKSEVVLARRDVQQDPPDYYRVGRLAGQCLACHSAR